MVWTVKGRLLLDCGYHRGKKTRVRLAVNVTLKIGRHQLSHECHVRLALFTRVTAFCLIPCGYNANRRFTPMQPPRHT